MDLSAVLIRATQVLRILATYDRPIHYEGVVANAGAREATDLSDTDNRNLSVQAMNLVEEIGFAHRPEPFGVELTKAGRSSIAKRPDAPIDDESKEVVEWFNQQQFNEALSKGVWTSTNTFTRLSLRDWRQFENVDIIFHDRLTVLTGVNAAGKTTLLNLLAPHFSWSSQILTGSRKVQQNHPAAIGKLVYSNNAVASLVVPDEGQSGVAVTSPHLIEQQQVSGVYISSHRSVSGYMPLQHLPARFSEADALLQEFSSEIQMRYQGAPSQFSPLYRMKEGLVSAALYGYGNDAVRANDEARSVWEGFQAILRKILPSELRFRRLMVVDGELFFVCADYDFPLEAASGGISALLELAWQIFLRSKKAKAFTVIIDEPENHLHPAVQRSFMPALLRAFPRVRFIVATHSPFVVTADAEAYVYTLERAKSGKVVSRRLDSVNAAATPDETLTRVLGLKSPLAIWVEQGVAQALSDVPREPTVEDLRKLRERFEAVGLDRQFPAALEALERNSSL
ncbi:AAA family ATPase [Curtobacterium sp. NPDC092190]|uniref:AAA family ATPase n=1 Tax=Curtobacterium sp. NPDC092190 TaxID=3363973 RepID=UPI0037F3FD29